MTGKRRRF